MHTSIYLDQAEFDLLSRMPGNDLVKTRYRVDGQPSWAIDVHETPRVGVVILEMSFAETEEADAFEPPEWVSREVTDDEGFTGSGMAVA